ncbi:MULTISPECIES: alanine racemase [unclassified Janthinobacterium]|uniref:alanine racemase n=1 Tax=unclassified Janthinobacterium TaxID=2610881 RepID=UPI0017C778A3|nr:MULTISPECIES: alanine racemase [unclassified Janthinobacterium]MBB5368855.1 alanine racemase [Janthinobacterium sp. K2C7]MBB5381609.1 alanine racemase [Janthinobacterium sp. K2Li3]MBB5387237.1 alanine racemase [Janthinobacterium sp. K2E3]
MPPKERSGAILTVDLGAVRANYRLLRETARPAVCSAVVKSDAYGLGAAQVGAALYEEGCRHFFVAHLEEGISLRPHVAIDADIFVLHGPPVGTEGEFTAHGLIPVLNSTQQVAGWRAHARLLGKPLDAIVQVDSGMSRMGLSPQEVDGWLADAHFLDGINVRYIMSHLACADERDHPMNAEQLARFTAIRTRLPQYRASLANSSGVFLSPEYHFDLVRPGAALYGIAPHADAPNPLRPVVRLQGKVLQTRTIAAGDHVGYSRRYTASEPRQVATVSVGYADGWLRSMSNQGLAIVDGVKVPQIGNISMDSITLDVSAIAPERLAPGSLVDLICAEHTVDAVAARANTIGYEVLTNLGGRYYREYQGLAQGLAGAAH